MATGVAASKRVSALDSGCSETLRQAPRGCRAQAQEGELSQHGAAAGWPQAGARTRSGKQQQQQRRRHSGPGDRGSRRPSPAGSHQYGSSTAAQRTRGSSAASATALPPPKLRRTGCEGGRGLSWRGG